MLSVYPGMSLNLNSYSQPSQAQLQPQTQQPQHLCNVSVRSQRYQPVVHSEAINRNSNPSMSHRNSIPSYLPHSFENNDFEAWKYSHGGCDDFAISQEMNTSSTSAQPFLATHQDSSFHVDSCNRLPSPHMNTNSLYDPFSARVFQPSVLYSHGKLLYMDYTGL
jgi:hypothetical protein